MGQKALKDNLRKGENLFEIEEACKKGTIILYLLSNAGQKDQWKNIKKYLTKNKALCFSHGFSITYKEQTGIVPTHDIDVILVAPKGSGLSVKRNFLSGSGINSSYAM